MANKIPQLKIWQNASGTWSVAYIDSFPKAVENFMIPCRAMNMTPIEFIKYVIEKYPNTHVFGREDGTFFSFYWREADYAIANKYKNDINKAIRQARFMI